MMLNPRCGRVSATEHAPRDPFRVLERRHGLVEIVGRGVGIPAERHRVTPPVVAAAGPPVVTPPAALPTAAPRPAPDGADGFHAAAGHLIACLDAAAQS